MRRFGIGICSLLVFAAALGIARPLAAQVNAPQKRHQATGIVAASSATQLVLLKKIGRNQVRWNFVVSAKTKLDGKPLQGARVRIFYYDDKGQRLADQIKLLAPATPPPR